MNFTEKTLSKKEIYNGKIIEVHLDDVLLPNGEKAKREVVEHPGGVAVAALTEDNEIFLVRQYRYPYSKEILEIPAGKLEKGEDPFLAAKREQLEETGTIGDKYISLGSLYPTPGYCSEIIRLWACRVTEYKDKKLDSDEFLDVEKIPLNLAVEMVLNNEISDAKTQVAILKTQYLLNNGSF